MWFVNAANPADSLPSNADANVTNPSKGTVTSVTDEDGNDISTEVKRKQFYTIVTADGQQYYLVIGMVLVVVVATKVLGGKKGKADQNDDELYGEGEEEEDEPEPLESLDETEE